jgi:hypothetical protein
MKTLIYPGTGWDSKWVEWFQNKGYTKFICYDTLPNTPHYTPGQVGYTNQQRFLEVLKERFGKSTKVGNKLFFPRYNLTYYINTDANQIEPPEGDVFICGFLPEWDLTKRIAYTSCCTASEADIVVHIGHTTYECGDPNDSNSSECSCSDS